MRFRALAALWAAGFTVCLAWGSALGVTGWAQPEYTAALSPNITGTGQACTDSPVMMLNHDGAATIQASVVQAGDEVLTHDTTADTLVTSYKLTGAALGASADADWVSSTDFIAPARSYNVEGSGLSEITFHVRGEAAPLRANDAGTYSASIIVTVLW